MPGALPKQDNAKLCSSYRVMDLIGRSVGYITNFNVKARGATVHHMGIAASSVPHAEPGKVW